MAYKDPAKKRAYQRQWETQRVQTHGPRKRDPDKSRHWPSRSPEKIRERNRRTYLKNREKRLAKQREWNARNPEYGKHFRDTHPGYKKAWRDANLEEVRAYHAQWNRDHPETGTAWRKAHPDYEQALWRTRRARKKNAPINDLTHAQWLEIQLAQDHRCYYCGKRRKGRLTQDHITPLSEGGSHTLHNVIAACHSCNARKGTRKPPLSVQPFLLTVAPAKKRKAS